MYKVISIPTKQNQTPRHQNKAQLSKQLSRKKFTDENKSTKHKEHRLADVETFFFF